MGLASFSNNSICADRETCLSRGAVCENREIHVIKNWRDHPIPCRSFRDDSYPFVATNRTNSTTIREDNSLGVSYQRSRKPSSILYPSMSDDSDYVGLQESLPEDSH
jgi:hypothetical protein